MVELQNNWIIVSEDDDSYIGLKMVLTFVEKGRKVKLKNGKEITTKDKPLHVYTLGENNELYIPIGLYDMLKSYFKPENVVDNRHIIDYNDNIKNIVNHIKNYAGILDGITLRPTQLYALYKILQNRNCIAQLVTGAGKTEILCALTKILADINNGKYMTVLMFEPTIKLVGDTVSRFDKYDIPVNNYSQTRKIMPNHVNICHPTALGNDIRKDSTILQGIDVLYCDECHHMRSDSCMFPINYMPHVQFRVGVSASAISQEHVGGKEIRDFTYSELMVIGATGQLVTNVTASDLIDILVLAKPVLVMLSNKADEPMSESDVANWSAIVKTRLESESRTHLVAEAADVFNGNERKTLILVNTKSMAHMIAKHLYDMGLGDITRQSYGGGVFEMYNGSDFVNCSDDVFRQFSVGAITILIGTSHLVEGVDVPNLDAVILAFAGKGERQHVQSLGRVLRKTKTGKYAWIIDFTDSDDIVLSKHSKIRLQRYSDIIGISPEHIYVDKSVEELSSIFNALEK